jgi:hypothetical protein
LVGNLTVVRRFRWGIEYNFGARRQDAIADFGRERICRFGVGAVALPWRVLAAAGGAYCAGGIAAAGDCVYDGFWDGE